MRKWWQKEKVRFQCQEGCIKCCQEPGIICLDDEDIRDISKFLDMTGGEFQSEYMEKEEDAWVIPVDEGKPCPFLTLTGCKVHEVKPKQCRAYPFWKENLRTRKTWKRTANFCPGIHEGPRIMPVDIDERLKSFKPPI